MAISYTRTKDTKVCNKTAWVDFCNIPLAPSGKYLWKEATKKRCKIPYKFDDKEEEMTLLEYDGHRFVIYIDGRNEIISRVSLSKCNLAKVMGKVSSLHKYNIGEVIQKGKTDITILKHKRNNKGNKTYIYKCNKCHQTGEILEGNIVDTGCCPVCSGKK